MPGTPGDIPPTRPGRAEATVVNLARRRPAPTRRPAGSTADDDAMKLALMIQRAYLDRDLSLADPDTAEAHRTTLDAVTLLLDGVHRLGPLDTDGLLHALRTMVEDARRAPELISGCR